MTNSRFGALFLAISCLFVPFADAGKLDREMEARWQGAWVLTNVELRSDCRAGFTDNRVHSDRATGGGIHVFERGELAQVVQLNVHRTRIDLRVAIHEPLRVSWQEGPFTLYDRVLCGAELEIKVPRQIIKDRDYDGMSEAIATALDKFSNSDDARDSSDWNEREVEPYPDDYETTVYEWTVWKAEQHNARVDMAIEESLRELETLPEAIGDNPDYLAGFAAGVASARAEESAECSRIVAGSFRRSAVGDEKKDEHGNPHSDEWLRGFRHGRVLTHNLYVVTRAKGCYLDMPEAPDSIELPADARLADPKGR